MRLNAYASQPHYLDHIAPIWALLPEHVRGHLWSPGGQLTGTTAARLRRDDPEANVPVLVASHVDATTGPARGRPLVYLEHGAGQTYDGDPAMANAIGWSSSHDRTLERVLLFLCPSETVAERWRSRYDAPAVAVGCPKLDHWHLDVNAWCPNSASPTVAVTFHWDCSLGPETRSAWPAYDRALPALVRWADENGVKLLGHGHPRLWSRIARRWHSLGVEQVPSMAEVLDRADVLVADNTSAMYEFASLDRPVVALNAPWYRRDVEHGLRFWSHVPGLQVNHRDELLDAVDTAVWDPVQGGVLRAAATAAAYARVDGQATQAAVDAIMEALA